LPGGNELKAVWLKGRWSDVISGTVNYLKYLKGNMRGTEVTVLTYENTEKPFLLKAAGKINRGNADVVHVITGASHMNIGLLYGVIVGALVRKKVVLHFLQNFYPQNILGRGASRALAKMLGNTAVLSGSMGIQKELKKAGVESRLYYPCVDTKELRKFYTKYKGKKDIDILCAVEFKRNKGYDTFIEAVSLLPEKFVTGKRIVLSGGGWFEEDAKAKIRELGMENRIEFIGPQKDIFGLIARSKALIVPYKTPTTIMGVSTIVMEALGIGTPMIAARIPTITEAVDDGKTALLFTPGNPRDLSEKFVMLAGNAKLMEKLSMNSLAAAEKFSAERAAKELEEIYRGL